MHGIETIQRMNEDRQKIADLERQGKQLKINEHFILDAVDQIHDCICPGKDGDWQARARQAVQEARSLKVMLNDRRRLSEYNRVSDEFGNEC